MYRAIPGTRQSFGLAGGPYAGQKRRLDVAHLPIGVRGTLRRALAGSGALVPLLANRAAVPFRIPPWVSAASACAMAGAAARGFGDVEAAGFRQGGSFAFATATVLGVGVASGALEALRRHRRLHFQGLPLGVFLLPLDVVEVTAAGVFVRPLGGLREGSVKEGPEGAALVLDFEDHVRIEFVTPSVAAAEHAFAALIVAQEKLVQLTHGGSLEDALRYDPFFEVRSGGADGARGWDALAPVAKKDPQPITAAKEPTAGVLLRFGAPLVLGGALGVALLAGRNRLSDDIAFERALGGPHTALEEYLSAGRSHRDEAERILKNFDDEGVPRTLTHPPTEAPLHATETEPAPSGPSALDTCRAAFARRAPEAYPRSAEIMSAVLRGETPRGRTFPVVFTRKTDPVLAAAYTTDSLDASEARVFEVLRIAASEACPTSILTFQKEAEVEPETPGLLVKTAVRARGGTREVDSLAYQPIDFVFDVELHAPSIESVHFELTMPTPEALTLGVRNASLFQTAGVAAPNLVPFSLTARAYDRLYDELYGLFFTGDPRVPVSY